MVAQPLEPLSQEELAQKYEKLKTYAQAMKGKELQLRERERQLKQKELQLKFYRKNILLAIKEQLADSDKLNYREKMDIIEKYRDILQVIAEDYVHDPSTLKTILFFINASMILAGLASVSAIVAISFIIP